jgi:hypothetical protein
LWSWGDSIVKLLGYICQTDLEGGDALRELVLGQRLSADSYQEKNQDFHTPSLS